ncbi:hypothetical protein GCM10020218_070220 [Dactylosporangium vinaceum]
MFLDPPRSRIPPSARHGSRPSWRRPHRGGSGDYRLGIAAFIVVEPSTGKVFNILATADRLFAEHEELPYPGVAAPFTRVVDDPLAGVGGPGFHAVAVELDRSRGHVAWTAGGRLLHEASGLSDLPAAVTIGFGLFTLLPIGAGRSSAQGQGARASCGHFRYHASQASTAGPRGRAQPRPRVGSGPAHENAREAEYPRGCRGCADCRCDVSPGRIWKCRRGIPFALEPRRPLAARRPHTGAARSRHRKRCRDRTIGAAVRADPPGGRGPGRTVPSRRVRPAPDRALLGSHRSESGCFRTRSGSRGPMSKYMGFVPSWRQLLIYA